MAVHIVLDALEPDLEIVPPKVGFAEDFKAPDDESVMSGLTRFMQSFESPEARGRETAGYILTSLVTYPEWSAKELEEEYQRNKQDAADWQVNEAYAMVDAARDLQIDPITGKKIPLKLFSLVHPSESGEDQND